MSGSPWSEAEVAEIRHQWAGGVDTAVIAKGMPGRSVSSVAQKAHQLGLERPASYIARVRAAACRAGGYGGRKRK